MSSTSIIILIAVLIYEIITIVGIGWYLNWKARKSATAHGGESAGEFTLGGRSLPWYVIGITMALTVLGSPHIFGLLEMSYNVGAVAVWFGLAHVVLLVVATLCTAKWVRKAGVTTMPEMLDKVFGGSTRLLLACVMPAVVWGVLSVESQGVGIVFATITGMSIPQGAIIGGILGILYVLLAGMKEIGWVNLINCAVMYVGLILAFIHITIGLPEGWAGVEQYYYNENAAYMLSIFGTPELFMIFAVANIISTVSCQSVSQQLIQPATSVNDPKGFKKALWVAAPLNGMFGVFIICIGLAARATPEYASHGDKMAGTMMLFGSLPPWLVAWLFAAFLGAILSSLAAAVMAPATIFTIDIYKNLYCDGKLDGRTEAKITRIAIVVLGVLAMLAAGVMPPIVSAMTWLFAWMTPVFVLLFFGMFWKRSTLGANITLLGTWIANCVWTFTPPKNSLGMANVQNAYVTLIASIVLALVFMCMGNSRPGYARTAS